MIIKSTLLKFKTNGNCQIVNLTDDVENYLNILKESYGISNGIITLFVPGSTGSFTTIEDDRGLFKDFSRIIEGIVPTNERYLHEEKWGDGNGHSHLRASIIGPSITIPFFSECGELTPLEEELLINEELTPGSFTEKVKIEKNLKILKIGDWQQIVFIDFDIKDRTRTVYIQAMGE